MTDGVIITFTILAGIIAVLFYNYSVKKECYTSSSLTNIGSFTDNVPHIPPENYDTMNQYGTDFNPFYPQLHTGKECFACREGFHNNTSNVPNNWNRTKTVDRLDRIDSSLLPQTSSNLTPYDIDVADPTAYTFQVHAPRVIRRDPLAIQADPVRGDIPINIDPDVPLVQRSQYGRDSLRLDGTFSDAFAKQYDRLTGKAYFNKPQYVSHGGTIMDM